MLCWAGQVEGTPVKQKHECQRASLLESKLLAERQRGTEKFLAGGDIIQGHFDQRQNNLPRERNPSLS